MILAQNHQQPLSGNKIALLIILSVLFLSACGTTKKVDDAVILKQDDNKSRGNDNAWGEMDTIQWVEVDKTKEYLETIAEMRMDKKDLYKIAVFMPMEISVSQESDAVTANTKLGRMTYYLAGMKMALNKLEQEGVNLDVHIFDAESGDFNNKLQQMQDADMIIGPQDSDQLAVVANFGRINAIPVISPWKSGSKISRNNPYFVQLKTGLKAHYEKLVAHALDNYETDQIFLLGRKKREDMTYMKYVQRVASALTESNDAQILQEFFIEEDSLMTGETAFDSIFYEDKETVFILPNWSFNSDEEFVYNTVRKMSGEKGLYDVVLYGMPILYESNRTKFEHYRALNMHICRSSFIDKALPNIKDFRQAYFDVYNDFPADEAYEGFDMMLFIGRSIFNYGKNFQFFLDDYASSLLQTKYLINKVYDGEDFENIQYFQNDHLYILKFIQNRFVAE